MSGEQTIRVRWTPDERDLVTERMAELVRAAPHRLKKDLWVAAQDVLDEGRRRKYSSAVTTLEKKVFLEARRRACSLPTPAIQVQAPVEPAVVYVPVPTPEPLAQVPVELLAGELVKRLLAAWTAGAPAAGSLPPLASALPASGRPTPAPAGAVGRERPVRIGVAGLLPDQFRHVKERVNGTKVDLVFVSNQTNPTKGDWPQSLDYAICTRHIRHGHEAHAREVVGRERTAFVQTGIESVVEQIEAWVHGARN